MIRTVSCYVGLQLLLIPLYAAGWFLGISAIWLASDAYTAWDIVEVYFVMLLPTFLFFIYVQVDGFKRGFSRKTSICCFLLVAALVGVGLFDGVF